MGRPKKLYKLISTGDKDAVIRYMERKKLTPQYYHDNNNDQHMEYPYYPVTQAASLGQLDIMNTLIEKGFEPDNKDVLKHDEKPPIHWACRCGHLDIVKCLIEDHNVDMNSKVGLDEDVPLVEAIEENYIEIVKYLVESGANVNDPDVLHECVRRGNPQMVKYILSKGVDVNARSLDQTTPLFHTAESEFSCSNALVLLDAGADVDAKAEDGTTTFLYAAMWHNIELMRLLISRGADPNVVMVNGDTALHMALSNFVISEDNEAIKYLVVELGLESLSARNSRSLTPVAMELLSGCDKSVLEMFVNYGCNITDEFDMLDDCHKEHLSYQIPNCEGLFQHLKQLASQPRSLKYLSSLKLRCHLGVRLESAVKDLPLPEILKDHVRIQKFDDDHDRGISGGCGDEDDDEDDEDDDDDDDDSASASATDSDNDDGGDGGSDGVGDDDDDDDGEGGDDDDGGAADGVPGPHTEV